MNTKNIPLFRGVQLNVYLRALERERYLSKGTHTVMLVSGMGRVADRVLSEVLTRPRRYTSKI